MAGAGGPGSRFKGKHSLDSDEEDDDDEGSSKYDILASEDVEGKLYPRIDSSLGGINRSFWECGQGRPLSLFRMPSRVCLCFCCRSGSSHTPQ